MSVLPEGLLSGFAALVTVAALFQGFTTAWLVRATSDLRSWAADAIKQLADVLRLDPRAIDPEQFFQEIRALIAPPRAARWARQITFAVAAIGIALLTFAIEAGDGRLSWATLAVLATLAAIPIGLSAWSAVERHELDRQRQAACSQLSIGLLTTIESVIDGNGTLLGQLPESQDESDLAWSVPWVQPTGRAVSSGALRAAQGLINCFLLDPKTLTPRGLAEDATDAMRESIRLWGVTLLGRLFAYEHSSTDAKRCFQNIVDTAGEDDRLAPLAWWAWVGGTTLTSKERAQLFGRALRAHPNDSLWYPSQDDLDSNTEQARRVFWGILLKNEDALNQWLAADVCGPGQVLHVLQVLRQMYTTRDTGEIVNLDLWLAAWRVAIAESNEYLVEHMSAALLDVGVNPSALATIAAQAGDSDLADQLSAEHRVDFVHYADDAETTSQSDSTEPF